MKLAIAALAFAPVAQKASSTALNIAYESELDVQAPLGYFVSLRTARGAKLFYSLYVGLIYRLMLCFALDCFTYTVTGSSWQDADRPPSWPHLQLREPCLG